MKKVRILLILIMLSVILTACDGSRRRNIDAIDEAETLIVTSFYPMYIFTSNIVKDVKGIRVINMTEPQTGCLHDYQLVPSDMKVLEKADLFVINGAGMESFLDKVISQLPNLKIIEASKGIELLVEGHEHRHDGEHEQNDHDSHEDGVNPHVWVSISKAIEEVQNITEALIQIDEDNRDAYQKNSEEYIQRLENIKAEMHYELKDIRIKDVITFHEAFSYFAKEFGLNIVSVVEREPGSEPSARELAETIKIIEELDVKILLVEPQYSASAAEIIANETGAKIYLLDPVVTGSNDASLDSYEVAMRENLKVLLEALK